jgi:hypothetical protein
MNEKRSSTDQLVEASRKVEANVIQALTGILGEELSLF